MKKSVLILLFSLLVNFINAQLCTAPSFNVDLSGALDTSWTLSHTSRSGVCCGSSNCVTFNVTLNPGTELVSFFVTSPSPSGSGFYQINCGTPVSIGVPFCAIGLASPFTITYCKPGNDNPNYIITAGTIVHASHDISIRETGCTDTLFVSNVETSSIEWTSIAPGSTGDYDNYLSCLSGCTSTLVTPIGTPPSYVDFQVSGNPTLSCGGFSRDTVRVNFVPVLTGVITPLTPTICSSSGSSVTLTAVPSGGAPPYSYLWSTGATTAAITTTLAGTYSVTIGDNTNCLPITISKTIGTLQSATFNYTYGAYCKNGVNPLPTFTGTAIAGTFSASPAGLSFVSTSTGEINLSASTVGTYTVTNTVPPLGVCPGTSATTTITINPFPVMTSTSTAAICSGGTVNIPLTSSLSSTYTWIAADNLNTAGESLSLQTTSTLNNTITNAVSSAQVVSYTVTPTAIAAGGCVGTPQTVNVTVNPIDNASFSYPEISNCQTGTDPVPTITGLAGGTFSSTAGLVFVSTSTGVIDLSASTVSPTPYVITYTTNGVCPNTATFPILITLAPTAIFSYTGTPYCQNESNPFPTFAPGAGGGLFTSTAGLIFVSSLTGEVNLAASTPGTYTVTNTIAASGGCAAATHNSTITITRLKIASFNYTGTPYCQNGSNPSPTFSGGGAAGTFSSTAGLDLNSSTGYVNLMGSTPGTYTVTNYFAATGGCPSVSATATITITALPIATFSYAGSPYCETAVNPLPGFISGGVAGIFSASSVYLNINSSTGLINLAASTPDAYIVTNTIPAAFGCPTVIATSPVTITALPLATFIYTGTPYCQNESNPTPTLDPSGTNGIYTAAPTGLIIDANAGTVNLASSVAGSYTVTNTIVAFGGCPTVSASSPITITTLPITTFSYSGSPYCQNASNPSPTFSGGGVAGTFTAPAGLSINASTGLVNLLASTPGTYNVTNTINASGGCPVVSTTSSITINPPATTNAGADIIICSGTTHTLSGSIGGGASSLIWTTSGTGTFDNAASATAIYTPSAGDISAGSVVLTITTNDPTGPCPAVSDAMNLTINPAATANAGSNATICARTNYTLSGSIGGGASSLTWTTSGTGTFDNASSATAIYTPSGADITAGSVTLTITTNNPSGPCPAVSDGMVLTITPRDNPSFSYGGSTFCQTGVNPTPTITGLAGGTFSSSSPLLSLNTTTGIVNLLASSLGTYVVTYTTSGPCPDTAMANVTVTIAPSSTFGYASSTYCTSGVNPLPIFPAGSSGGTFSSAAGLMLNLVSGEVVLSGSTPGTYTVTNTIPAAGGCAAAISTTSITIEPAAIANAGTDATICSGTTYNLSGSVSGGGSTLTWTTGGTGTFDNATSPTAIYTPSAADITAGNVTLTLTTNDPTGPCPSVNDAMIITIDPAAIADAGVDATICSGSTYTLSASVSGGASTLTWSTSGSGTFDNTSSATAVYTPSVADISAGNVTLTITTENPSGPCPSVSDAMVLTIDPAAMVSAGGNAVICSGATHTLSGSINGGATSLTWTTSGTGTFDNAFSATAIYTPSALDRSVGMVTLTITTNDPAGPCSSVYDDMVLTITPRDNATFNYGSSTFCQTGTNPTPTITGLTGGTFSSSSPLLIVNPTTGVVNLGGSTLGTYVVTYTTAGPCPDFATANITVTIAPSATFSYTAAAYCSNATDPAPNFPSGSSGGIFSSTSGLVINPISGMVDLSASTPGTYTINNTIVAAGGCASAIAASTITINPLDNAGFTYSSVAYCASAANQSPIISGVSGGAFTSTPFGLSINATTGTVNISASTPGTYLIMYTTTGICFNNSIVNFTINALPIASAGANVELICGTPYIILNGSGSSTGDGINYTWNTTDGNIISGETTTTPFIDELGTYYLTVVDTNGCSASDTISVTASAILPIASFTTSPVELTGIAPVVMEFTNTSQNSNTYVWDFGDGSSTTSSINANNTFTTPGTYTIILISSNNGECSDTASVTISVTDQFFIPEGFSPNGDGVNDLFVIRGIYRYPNNKFVVFNRWGNKVYEANPYKNEWDGKTTEGLRIGESELPVGTYFFVLDLGDDSKEIKGTIYLNK